MADTNKLGVIGSPIGHSLSPMIHKHFGSQFNIDIEYERIEADASNFNNVAQIFFYSGGLGLNITVPNKATAFLFCEEHSDTSKKTKVVNTIHKQPNGSLFGHNTDPIGLIADLEKNHAITIEGKRILLIGAGGAAAGILPSLYKKSSKKITITNRTPERAYQLLNDLGLNDQAHYVSFGFSEGSFDIVINATSAGLHDSIPKINPSLIRQDTVCYDLNYAVGSTEFLTYCKSLKAQTCIDGWGMLVEQAAQSFELWFNKRPNTETLLLNRPK
jgi:shikimate dehydrogenase